MSPTCSSQWCRLVKQKPCHALICLGDNACKRSITICHKSRALCPISTYLVEGIFKDISKMHSNFSDANFICLLSLLIAHYLIQISVFPCLKNCQQTNSPKLLMYLKWWVCFYYMFFKCIFTLSSWLQDFPDIYQQRKINDLIEPSELKFWIGKLCL